MQLTDMNDVIDKDVLKFLRFQTSIYNLLQDRGFYLKGIKLDELDKKEVDRLARFCYRMWQHILDYESRTVKEHNEINQDLYSDWKEQVIYINKLETMLSGLMLDFDNVLSSHARLRRKVYED